MIARRIGAGLAGLAVVVLGAGPCLAASSPWTLQSAPPSGDDAFLLSVSADSNTDAWAVGAIDKSGAKGPLIDHWNGTSWSQSAAPSYPSGETTTFDGISASSTSNAWAAGYYYVSRYDYYPTTALWNGSTWTIEPAAQCETGGAAVSSDLLGVASVSPTEAFAVGECVSQRSEERRVGKEC